MTSPSGSQVFDILHGMHGHIDHVGEEGLFKLLREESLAADFGQGRSRMRSATVFTTTSSVSSPGFAATILSRTIPVCARAMGLPRVPMRRGR